MREGMIDPVDERLPAGRLVALGLQHVLVMYAGAIAVPLIVGGALKRSNHFIVAVSIGTGMIPLVASNYFAQMPKVLSPILYSGILLASIMAVLLNAFFNGGSSATDAQRAAAASAHAAEP